MEFGLAVILLIAIVAIVVLRPLTRPGEVERRDAARHEELEAAKEAKYREIRDAELDRRTGKLDDADWKAIDRQLRAEAVAILREIDKRGGEQPPPAA